jgi:sugar (pentulose or hexulose) kinase
VSEGGPVFVGLDLGTSGLKGVVCSSSLDVLARAAAGYPTQRPEAGAAEQDPADWIAAVREVVGRLAGAVAPGRWRCIGLSAMIPTLVTADGNGSATGPAVTWEDARGEPYAERLLGDTGDLYEATGQRVDGRYLLPMLARLGSVDPDRVRRSAWVLSAKDFLFGWLTRQLLTDPSTAAGFGAYQLTSGSWSAPALTGVESVLGVPRPDLPTVLPATTRVTISPERAVDLGLPASLEVCLGAADSVTGAEGVGAADPGKVAYVAGTSTVILAVAERLLLDESRRYLVTPTASEHRWGLEMDLLATGSALRWLSGVAGVPEEELVREALRRDPARAPTFLPYLTPGEQGALWDPGLTGSVHGLTLGHDLADVARGLLSGVLVESRRCLEVLETTLPTIEAVHVGGGGMGSRVAAQELADVTGHVVVWSSDRRDHSAVGAAALAARSCGVSVSGTGDHGSGLALSPRPDAHARWTEVVARHDAVLTAVRNCGAVPGRLGAR